MDDIELAKFCEERYKESITNTIEQIIEYCRNIQKEYILGDGEISGVRLLTELLIQGGMEFNQYLIIKEAVENYNTPYEINLNYG